MDKKITYIEDGNSLNIIVDRKYLKDIKYSGSFYLKILGAIFLNCQGKVITVQPQGYSLTYELPPPEIRTIGRIEIAINNIQNFDSALLEAINDSEEFNRGLLAIVIDRGSLDYTIDIVLKKGTSLPSDDKNIKDTLVFCDADGDCLHLYNSRVSLEKISSFEAELKQL